MDSMCILAVGLGVVVGIENSGDIVELWGSLTLITSESPFGEEGSLKFDDRSINGSVTEIEDT